MSRRSKHRPVAQTPQADQPKRPLPTALIVTVAAVLLLGGIPFALGKYIELNSPDPFDGGAYAYSAQRLLNGAKLWVDEYSSAQPCTLLCNVIGVKLFGYGDVGPNVVQMLLQIGGLAMLFYTVRRLFGSAAAAVSTILAAILLSAPVVAKFGNVKEQFMIPFAIVAACAFALHETGGKKHWAVLAGAASIIPFYFKATGIAIVVAIGVYLVCKLILKRRQWKSVFVTIALWVVGAVLGLGFPGVLFVWQGAPGKLLNTFPAVLLEGIVFFSVLGFVLFSLLHYVPWKAVGQALRTVRRKIWIRGLAAMGLVLLLSIALISLKGAHPSSDIPSYVRSLPFVKWPVRTAHMVTTKATDVLRASGVLSKGGYVGLSRRMRPLSEQAPQVFRYYNAVGAIVYPAAVTVLLAAGLWLRRIAKKQNAESPLHAVAGLLALWWLMDMALVWISPHSYEQYYLPLCGSGAMLIAYAVWLWSRWLSRSVNKIPPVVTAGAAGLLVLIWVVPVFAGFRASPDTGAAYQDAYGRPERRRGFAQSLATVGSEGTAPWQAIGDYIRANSTPDQTMYVWGWFPGIYVQAERMAPVPRAYEADMHIMPPQELARQVDGLIDGFEANPPKFLVDSRKRHFPFDRPPLELWPIVPPKMFGNEQARLLDTDPREIEAFEQTWSQVLTRQFGDDEAKRFAAMKPFRDFVMTRYRVVRQFGYHILFERKD